MKRLLTAIAVSLFLSSCSSHDNAHTTATIYIAPPPHQILTVASKPVPAASPRIDSTADPQKPLLIFNLEDKKTFRVGEEVPIDFSVRNAKLKADSGDFRVRYIIDDDDMKWLDNSAPFWLAGWTPGKHTVRLELIGPDGWPYKNGNANIVTREILIVP